MAASFGCIVALWIQLFPTIDFSLTLLKWIKVGDLRLSWGIFLDPLSLVMCTVVTLISFLVHIYSLGYMAHDAAIGRFMSYLSFFTFMMLILVMAPNMPQLFVGWEGVGVASYLLIGFWYERAKAGRAAMKAFIVNRVGDAGLLLAMGALFATCGTLDFHGIFVQLPSLSHKILNFLGLSIHGPELIAALLFIGAMGKSAQFGLHVWLPDAMEGPTPVSALIHAATMVTAGIFLMVRFSPLVELAPYAKMLMVWVGSLTAFFAGTVALVQKDIKKIIAYSTCSQLGYMVLACGCGAYAAAIFHLVTHAFFKALLFLGAGSVIHSMSDEQDISKMGGIYKHIPKTYAFMWIGSLAIAGIPFFAGYYSKDAILSAVFMANQSFAFSVGLLVAGFTAFYSWRLLFVVFHGEPHANEHVLAHVHESPPSMLIPLWVLAVGSVVSGWLGYQWFILEKGFSWQKSLVVASYHHAPLWVELLPFFFALVGFLLAYGIYIWSKKLPACGARGRIIHILENAWFVDAFYNRCFVKPALFLGTFFWKNVDKDLIDTFGPDGVAKTVGILSKRNSKIQTGYTFHYALAMILALMAVIGIYIFLFSKHTLFRG
jgi:NADH-quinone oxidoreductase subunit L